MEAASKCVCSIDRDCLAGRGTNALSKNTKMETRKCGRRHDHSWLRSGAEIATFPRRLPNQTTLPRAGRLSRLTLPKSSCVMPIKRSAGSIALRKLAVRVDIEAKPPKLGPFIEAINAALSDRRP